MARMVVGTFPTREHAEAARRELAAEGFGEAHAEYSDQSRTTLASIIDNVFSGLVPPPPYARALQEARERGHWTLAIRGLDHESAARARSLIDSSGGADVHEGDAPDEDAELGTLVAIFGPDRSVLPGSPVGWDQARAGGRPASIGRNDPFVPRGDVNDASGLGPRNADELDSGSRTGTVPGSGRQRN